MNATEKIQSLHQEIETVEQEDRDRIMAERAQDRANAEEKQERINQLLDNMNALLKQNAADLLQAITKAEEAVGEAQNIATMHNDSGSGFLLNKSISVFCGDEVSYLKKLLHQLQIATPSCVIENAVKVVANAGMTEGYGANRIHYPPGTVFIKSAREADKLLRDSYGRFSRID